MICTRIFRVLSVSFPQAKANDYTKRKRRREDEWISFFLKFLKNVDQNNKRVICASKTFVVSTVTLLNIVRFIEYWWRKNANLLFTKQTVWLSISIHVLSCVALCKLVLSEPTTNQTTRSYRSLSYETSSIYIYRRATPNIWLFSVLKQKE